MGRARTPITVLAVGLAALACRVGHAESGAELYAEACASCHGADGRGRPEGSRIEVPLPDFSDCAFVTAEATGNWAKLVRSGGPALGLSAQMPAFGAALDESQILAILAYVRGFCRDPAWPIGDLNYRRGQLVTKAFPENEVVLTAAHAGARGRRETEAELSVERRLGPRAQLEVGVPLAVVDGDAAAPITGAGDVAVSYGHVLAASAATGGILSAGVDCVLPTGNRRHGVGSGTLTMAPRLLGAGPLGPLVVQAQVQADLPVDPDRADRQMVYGVGVGLPLAPSKRAVVPAIELEQTHAIASDVRAATLLAPQVYLPLSRSGHVALSVGGVVPVAGTRPFDWQARAFLLWDYADGPFWRW